MTSWPTFEKIDVAFEGVESNVDWFDLQLGPIHNHAALVLAWRHFLFVRFEHTVGFPLSQCHQFLKNDNFFLYLCLPLRWLRFCSQIPIKRADIDLFMRMRRSLANWPTNSKGGFGFVFQRSTFTDHESHSTRQKIVRRRNWIPQKSLAYSRLVLALTNLRVRHS